jgi:hypothetical protein
MEHVKKGLDFFLHAKDSSRMSCSTLWAQTTGANPFSFSVGAVSLNVTDNTATLVTTGPHGMAKGWGIIVQGADKPECNGTFEVESVVSPTSLTFVIETNPPLSGNVTGTIVLRRWLRSSDFGGPLLLDPASGALMVKTV